MDLDVGLLRGVIDGNVERHGKRDKEKPTNDGAKVDEESNPRLHEPPDGKHGRRERHANVGVGKRIPKRLFRPVRVFEGSAIGVDARWLVNLAVGIQTCQAVVPDLRGLGDEVKEGHFSVPKPDERVFDEEQPRHRHHGPDTDGFQRISCMFNGSSAYIR